MAARFWVGGTGTWDGSSTSKWSTSSGGASGASAPTAGDDVTIDTSSGNGTITIAAGAVCNDCTINWTAVKNNVISLSANFSPAGTLSIQGNSAINRILVQSSVVGTPRTITATLGTMANVDFKDIVGAGAGSWNLSSISGGSGDCDGNSGITFTTSETQSWSGTTGGNWSTNAWTSRVPLPQDDVTVSKAFSASQTIVLDMPRLGRSIDFTGSTGTPTIQYNSTGVEIFGGLKYIAGMSVLGSQTLTWSGRRTCLFTNSGRNGQNSFTFSAPGGVFQIQDTYSNSSSNWTHNHGTVDINAQTITVGIMASNNSNTRSFLCNGATINVGSGAAATTWSFGNTAGLTFAGDTSTIVVSSASANARLFNGGGLRYGTLKYIVAGSTGKYTIQGSNSFDGIQFSDATNARTLEVTGGTTQTIRTPSAWLVNGAAGRLITLKSTNTTPFTIVSTGYFYAGLNTTDSGNNTGWSFAASPGGENIGSDYLDLSYSTAMRVTGFKNLLLLGVG